MINGDSLMKQPCPLGICNRNNTQHPAKVWRTIRYFREYDHEKRRSQRDYSVLKR